MMGIRTFVLNITTVTLPQRNPQRMVVKPEQILLTSTTWKLVAFSSFANEDLLEVANTDNTISHVR